MMVHIPGSAHAGMKQDEPQFELQADVRRVHSMCYDLHFTDDIRISRRRCDTRVDQGVTSNVAVAAPKGTS